MQPVSPYRLTAALGRCDVGSVWSAVDERGGPLTVAVLDAAVARDQRWRDAFAATVNALAQPGTERPRHVSADFSAAAPWAAYEGTGGEGPGAERVFEALGMPVHAAPDASPAPAPAPTGADPADPTSAPPDAVSAPPTSPAADPYEPAAPGSYDLVYSSPEPDPFSSPVRHIVPSEPRRRRTGLWIGAAVLVAVVLAGGGTLLALTSLGGDDPPPSPTAPGGSPEPVALPTTPPVSPGVEPPAPGSWPVKWPRFTASDSVRTFNLDGLGFPVKVPLTWQCTLAGRAAALVKYTCGTPPGEKPEFGGDLTVRSCPQPCAQERQTELRQSEEAWGARWIRSGPSSTYAEAILQVDGEQRHGLVVVAFWRGGSDGQIDRQLVFRMTSPVREAQQLRRIATYLRDTLVF